jgi:hypothetical protein
MARPKDNSFRYRAPIERRRVPNIPMPKGGWGKAAPMKVYSREEINRFLKAEEEAELEMQHEANEEAEPC